MAIDFEQLPVLMQKAREVLVLEARQALAPFDLTEQQWRVIRAIYQANELNAQTLAHESALLGPSLSRILNRLESSELLARKISPGDQRELLISLTAKGKRLHNRVQPKMAAAYAVLGEKTQDLSLDALISSLHSIAALSEQHTE